MLSYHCHGGYYKENTVRNAMFKRLYDHKDLLFVFIWREFVIRYKQSVIGVLWAVLQPVSMMMLFVLVFGIIMKTPTKNYPFVLFFYGGVLPWTFFAAAMNFAIPSLTNNISLITKIYFPREVIPLSGIAVCFLDYLLGFLVYLVLLFCYSIPVNWNFLWYFPLMGLLVVFTTAMSYFLSALNVYYRDVKLATAFLLQLWFFFTPVIYSIDSVDVRWKYLLFLNPLTFIIENMRRVTIEGRGLVVWQLCLETLFVMAFFAVTQRIFIKIERAFADVI
jgi:ABC-type polysaccharide/polyol phosphate export permease